MGDLAGTHFLVRGDDLGMHSAIDEGILAAFKARGLDEAAFIAVGPTAPSGALRAVEAGMPITLHLAFSCDWDAWRWSSLTGLIDDDGSLPPHPHDLADAPREALIKEARAQLDRARKLGLRPESFNFHVDAPHRDLPPLLEQALGIPCRDIPLGNRPTPAWFASYLNLSPIPQRAKQERIREYLASAGPGRHCIVAHPGLHALQLRRMCTSALAGRLPWACDYRIADAQLLANPDAARKIRKWLEREQH